MAYTEKDGKAAQRAHAELERKVAAIREATRTATDDVEHANTELQVRPGLEGTARVWNAVVLGLGILIAASMMAPTLIKLGSAALEPQDEERR